MVTYDSLNRHMLAPYGCDWVHTPNFDRLARRAVTYDKCYIGSTISMPARRELHTGRYNFLHRDWGPLEPFDDSMPEILGANEVYTHLVTDHYHYWEDGGATYHTRYNSFEFARGQEWDPWKGRVGKPEIPPAIGERPGRKWRQAWVNRGHIVKEKDYPQAVTFAWAADFLRSNRDQDQWFLHVETFDPHEPFQAPERFKGLYPHEYGGPHFDWPPYAPVTESADQVAHARFEYAALVSMCDEYLGRLLDLMDDLDLWKDTMLIVSTDHGTALGEHGWWAKCYQPFYNEIALIPLFVWDPRTGLSGVRSDSLVQTIDLAPTLLAYFQLHPPVDMQGRPLGASGTSDPREAVLFGMHGGHVNVTDGRYVYMRAPESADNKPLYNYTLMPTYLRSRFSPADLRSVQLAGPFSFTKECQLLRTPAHPWPDSHQYGNLLFDLDHDPDQLAAIDNQKIEARMISSLLRLMEDNDAPADQYERLGLR